MPSSRPDIVTSTLLTSWSSAVITRLRFTARLNRGSQSGQPICGRLFFVTVSTLKKTGTFRGILLLLLGVGDVDGGRVELVPRLLSSEIGEADFLVRRFGGGPIDVGPATSGLSSVGASFALMLFHFLQFPVVDEPLQERDQTLINCSTTTVCSPI